MILLFQTYPTRAIFSLTRMKVPTLYYLQTSSTMLILHERFATLIEILDGPLAQDDSGYSTEFSPPHESGFTPELADSSNLVSSCQAQRSTSDIFKSDFFQARGLNEDTSDLFQEASNDNGSPAACTNTDTRGSTSGSGNPGTGSNKNNDNSNNQRAPDPELKGADLFDIDSKKDEDLCPTGLDGIKQAPLCCWSVRNVFGSFRKYACFSCGYLPLPVTM